MCPAGEHTAGFWTNFPIGRVEVGRNVLEGRYDITDAPVQAIYECLLCGNCRETCGAVDMETFGPLIDHPRIVKAIRAELYASGAELPPEVHMFCDTVEKSQNVMGYPQRGERRLGRRCRHQTRSQCRYHLFRRVPVEFSGDRDRSGNGKDSQYPGHPLQHSGRGRALLRQSHAYDGEPVFWQGI